MPTNLETCETWFRRVWHERDASAIDEMMSPETPFHGLGQQTHVGPEAFRAFHAALLALIPELTITIDKAIEDGDWIALLCSAEARGRESGESFAITFQGMARIQDGVILEAYNHIDMIALFSGCGLMPSDAVERCLGGQRVA